MKKISIIIPNYNGEKFLVSCLNSVINQKYPNKEIIIVDDGSTDNSVKTIKRIISKNKKMDIKLICQDNLNAAIARNNGMKKASGDYVLFLDSDDCLKSNILSDLIRTYEFSNADLMIGGYEEMSEDGEKIKDQTFSDINDVIDVRKNFSMLSLIDPVPANKIYDLKIIRKYNIQWGNVRIGQDLDFYLKYLSVSKNVLLTDKIIYKYRIAAGSMSRTYDFKIFDIVNVFPDIEKFYIKNGNSMLYKKYIPVLMLKHFNSQLHKQIFYNDIRVRRMIFEFFIVNERKIDYSLCEKNPYLRKIHRKFSIKRIFKFLYVSNIYRKYKIKIKS